MQSIAKIFSEEFGVSRETFAKLQEYVNLIIKWNKAINLISSNDIEDIWQKHILISAELMLHIPNKDIRIVDLGSGSGIPGMVLSIMGIKEMVLVESNNKKAAFLLQAAQISDFQVRVVNERIEKQQLECDIITSRALASTDKLISFTKYVHFNDSMILIKGVDIEDETNGLDGYELESISSRYSESTTIVKIKKTDV